jgi:hypothetical protein
MTRNIGNTKVYKVIRLRYHKKKQKCCRKESTLLPVNGTYTCRRDTTFVFQHINTEHDLHGGRGTIHTARTSCTAFPEWSVQRPRWSSVDGQLHSVVLVRTQVTWRTPTRKSLGEFTAACVVYKFPRYKSPMWRGAIVLDDGGVQCTILHQLQKYKLLYHVYGLLF